MKIIACKGCNKAVNEDETSMCVYCLSRFCDRCEPNCACQQFWNQILDAEEAVAAGIAALTVN
jgi:hypothetical protein